MHFPLKRVQGVSVCLITASEFTPTARDGTRCSATYRSMWGVGSLGCIWSESLWRTLTSVGLLAWHFILNALWKQNQPENNRIREKCCVKVCHRSTVSGVDEHITAYQNTISHTCICAYPHTASTLHALALKMTRCHLLVMWKQCKLFVPVSRPDNTFCSSHRRTKWWTSDYPQQIPEPLKYWINHLYYDNDVHIKAAVTAKH